jgi:MFS family permease
MAFQPAASLNNRTFHGLIIAQFLAGFNDQAIHAMAMFYARHTGILTEAQAISLMPILFYAPWAIFCTISGYLADRFSKTYSLITWKISEIFIALVLVLGFFLGTNLHMPAGAWIVMSTVFMMGTHAAFFAPAKYGAMPEILQPHILSRGNGILESTTFLASILGTVCGGFLFFQFQDREIWVGVIILVLSVIGAAASLMIAYLPPSNPTRLFPVNLIKPLITNLRLLLNSRPLALSVMGIAFFIFMVAYMRSSVYMHGEARHWPEWRTSLIVATVALGVGLGSPLAGYLSGGKIELGLVPLACIGMAAATFWAGLAIDHTISLVAALIVIGFFSGFYMVPLYTLLQHRAPKTSKGDLVATSNFINVTGAISASILFFLLVKGTQLTGIVSPVAQTDAVAVGVLHKLHREHGHVTGITIKEDDGTVIRIKARPRFSENWPEEIWEVAADEKAGIKRIELDDDLLELLTGGLTEGDRVVVSKYALRGVDHYLVRADAPADWPLVGATAVGLGESPISPAPLAAASVLASLRGAPPLKAVYDYELLPRYLFIGAALMTLGILVLLTRKLPDFFVRMFFWMWSLGRVQIREVGLKNLPTNGPVVLATNAHTLRDGLELVSVTDRTTKVVLPAGYERAVGFGILRTLAPRMTVIEMPPATAPHATWDAVRRQAEAALAGGHLLAVAVEGGDGDLQSFLTQVRRDTAAPIVPVFCGPIDPAEATPRIRVVFGQSAKADATLHDLRAEIDKLGNWVRHHDDDVAAVDEAH